MDKNTEAILRQVSETQALLAQRQEDQSKESGQAIDQLAQILKQQSGVMKEPAAAHTGTLLHGPGGLFNTGGLDNAIISLHVKSRGLGQLLPAFPSQDTHPFFGFLTGFANESGGEPVNPCDAAPKGFIKSGTLTAKFGHVARDTNTIRLPDTIKRLHRGDFTDLMMINSFLNPDSRGVYYPQDIDESNFLDMVTKSEQVIVGVNLERKLGDLLWNGDASIATAQEGYVEFPGLDAQIATTQVDAETGAAMASADSIVADYAYQEIGATDIVGLIEELEDHMFQLANDQSLSPVSGVIVMRPNAWNKLSNAWPVQQVTQPDQAVIAANDDTRILIDARTNVEERNRMRQTLTLNINGRTYNVVTDTGITEEDSSTNAGLGTGEFASSIYFVPLTVVGGFPVTYWQYLNHQLSVPQTQLLRGMETWWTDGGRFLWSYDGKYTCFDLKAETDPRVILRTPHLAWKIQNVKYTKDYPYRSPDPTSSYWKDGGVSIRNLSGPTQNAVWL